MGKRGTGLLSGLLIAGLGLILYATGTPGRAAEQAPSFRLARAGDVDPATIAMGQDVYNKVCAACHESGASRAPQRFTLEMMAPESIHRALTTGIMRPMAASLSDPQKAAVAEFLSGRRLGQGGPAVPLKTCRGAAARFDRAEPPVFSGWGLDPASTHSISTAQAGIGRASVGRLKLKWALAFPNGLWTRSEPALAAGAVFVGSHDGTVYALDRQSGCVRWTASAGAEVRTGIVVSPWRAGDARARPTLFFGDLAGNLYAVEAFTGRQLWRRAMDPHASATLTGTPTLYKGVLYVPVSSLEEGSAADTKYRCCTFRGSLVAVDPATGAEKWRTYMTDPPVRRGVNAAGAEQFGPSGAAIWNSPAVDAKRGQIYVATGDNYSNPPGGLSDAIVAFDLATGKIRWSYQAREGDVFNVGCLTDQGNCPEDQGPDFDFGAGTLLARGHDGRDYVLAGQKGGTVYALDPDNGRLVWHEQVGRGGMSGGILFGLAAAGGTVFVPIGDGPDGRTYDKPGRPGLYALDIATGRSVWRAPSANVCGGRRFCVPGHTGAISATPELLFAGSDDGYLRILDAASGRLLWQNDTVRDVMTVNGVKAHGGSMSGGAAPIAYKGMLLMNSGYGFGGKMPGNVLLAFSVE